MNTFATQVIDTLGGTAAVSRIFGIALSSVSNWRDHGIPKSRVMYLEVAKRKQLRGIDLKAATAPVKRTTNQPKTQEA
ncbi:helix-turn-helix domain-containing protein [Diaphorobacter caeni]|uniref:hypothetical protein n=1 Tax=Diaphorobacter caeni TaxID=2784387 RepID=UPI00188F2A33|nr:hypothetical protein [Diaphorobacter caeni]MBF5007618.1 hypothetical protein [Diaphorobacter caeni]